MNYQQIINEASVREFNKSVEKMKNYTPNQEFDNSLSELDRAVYESLNLSLGQRVCDSLGLPCNASKLRFEVTGELRDVAYVTATFVYENEDLKDFFELVKQFKVTEQDEIFYPTGVKD